MQEPTSSTNTTIIGLSVGRDLIVHNGDVTSVIVNPAPEPPPIVTQFQQFESPTPHFTGRDEILNELHSLMSSCQTKSEYIEKIVVLHGCGGIGKSELARTFAKISASNPAIHNVAWINADSLLALTSSFTRLAKRLRIGTENRIIEEIVQQVYEHFSENIQKGLFIFDNARQMNDDEFPIINYMPAYMDTYPLFLITTQHNTWDEISSQNKIHVQELSKKDSVKFLTKRIQLSAEQQNSLEITNALKDLAKALQGFPLALALAGSNILNSKMDGLGLETNIRKYIEGINVPQGGWTNLKQTGAATKYKLIMDNVWDLTLERIRTLDDGDEARKLLNVLAYILPDDITFRKILQIYKRTFDKVHKEIGLYILEQHSLISIHKQDLWINQGSFDIRIHRLIQLCTRDKLDKIKDYSFLLGHCKYILRPGYDGRHYVIVKDDKIHIHRHLKIRCWPGELVAYSVFFIDDTDLDIMPEILEDLCNFFKDIDSDSVKACQEVTELFYLYLFKFKFKCNPQAMGFLEKCNTIFVEQVHLYIEQLVLSAGSPVLIPSSCDGTIIVNTAQNLSLQLCQELLISDRWQFKHLTTRVVDIVRGIVASTNGGCRLDSISHLYQVLWRCNWNVFEENAEVALDCVRLAFAKHFHFVPSVVSKEDQDKYWDNWQKDGPLPLRHILKQLNRNMEWSNLFLELFAPNEDGARILIHTLQYENLGGAISGGSFQIFEFLIRLCCDWGLAEKLVQSTSFMDALLQNTRMALELTHDVFNQHQLLVMVTWFALFSHNETFRDTDGQSWSILSVADELETFLNLVESSQFVLVRCREGKLMRGFLNATSSLTAEMTQSIAVPIKFAQAYIHKFGRVKQHS